MTRGKGRAAECGRPGGRLMLQVRGRGGSGSEDSTAVRGESRKYIGRVSCMHYLLFYLLDFTYRYDASFGTT